MPRLQFQRTTRDPEATEAMGAALAHLLRPGDVVLLEGELGAGKTALVRGIAAGCGVAKGSVSSPTFVVINIYPSARPTTIDTLIHVDAYRVSDTDELENVGWDHLFDPATKRPRGSRAAVIEWPSRVTDVLPSSDSCAVVRLTHAGETDRTLAFELPESWNDREGVHALATRPPVRCSVSRKWVAPTNPAYPFIDDRSRNADLFQWLVGPDDEAADDAE